MRFRDELVIRVRGGRGGKGAVAFLRQKFTPRGGPAGGRGGDGGSVVIRVDPSLNTLYHLAGRPLFKGQDGAPGGGNNRSGKRGHPLVLHVPAGTVLRDAATGRSLGDLNRKEDEVVAAQGGKGGLGNKSFANSTRQTPRYAEPGEAGEERRIALELKMIADAGLVGLPNAGKSTLLSALSRARPKVASYPFTTLTPSLGVVGDDPLESFVLADLPGLIEGASRGAGLGDRFLRHIERTRVVVHIVDVSGSAVTSPAEAYRIVREELEAFSPALASKPEIVVANKIDLKGATAGGRRLAAECGETPVRISAGERKGLRSLLRRLREALPDPIEKTSSRRYDGKKKR